MLATAGPALRPWLELGGLGGGAARANSVGMPFPSGTREMPMTSALPRAAESKPGKPEFQWDDPLLLDAQLAEDERLIRDTTRQYCQDKLMGRVLEAFRHERFDRD